MLNQKRSGNRAKLKDLVTIALCIGLLSSPILVFSKTYRWAGDANKTIGKLYVHNKDDITAQKNIERALLNLSNTLLDKLDTLSQNAYMFTFIQDLNVNVKYPAEAVTNKIGGHAIATFTVANYKLKNIKIIIGDSKGYGIPEEITRVLQNCRQPVNILPGKYALAFYFFLGEFSPPHAQEDDKIIFKGVPIGFTFLGNHEIIIQHP